MNAHEANASREFRLAYSQHTELFRHYSRITYTARVSSMLFHLAVWAVVVCGWKVGDVELRSRENVALLGVFVACLLGTIELGYFLKAVTIARILKHFDSRFGCGLSFFTVYRARIHLAVYVFDALSILGLSVLSVTTAGSHVFMRLFCVLFIWLLSLAILLVHLWHHDRRVRDIDRATLRGGEPRV